MSVSNQQIKLEHEMRTSFLNYSMSVIVSRALPDVRDGLKPVHRRILYAMHGLKVYHNKPYLKSARIIGDVLGKYHPHGDSAVYEALVRMAQNFSMRYPLIDGQGNFGSIDGDSAAAMRYTESRMKEISEYLLSDLDKGTVDFVPNYDNKDTEPAVLPAKIPQLLVNGASGIAVGMATNVPPHNLNEVMSGLKLIIDKPDATVEEIMEHIPGPDFPTGAEIHGVAGIVKAYKTGRGSVVMRAKASVEEISGKDRILISEIPYQVNKSRLIEKIADLVREKKIEGISDIRDESAKEDIRVVIECKRGESGEIILNHLYKQTPLQSSFGVNTVALVRGIPKLLNIKDLLKEFYQHRREVILRRTAHLLAKAEERAHILLGLKTAVENVDDVVEIIRKAPDTPTAQANLIKAHDLSEIQAKAILDMRLARLTGLERDKIVAEFGQIMEEIEDFKDILNTPQRVTDMILEDIEAVTTKFGDERRTTIHASAADELTMESLVADSQVTVTVSYSGYIKRTPSESIQAQKRGGKGRSAMLTKDEDFTEHAFSCTNHQDILCFSNKGQVYKLKVYQIPEAALRSRGKHFANLVPLSESERIVKVLPIDEFRDDAFVVSLTKKGYIKKTALMAYSNVRISGIIGLKLDDQDELIGCAIVNKDDHILIGTSLGKAIRFNQDEVREMGRASRGVTGIRFGEDEDFAIGLEVITNDQPNSTILSVCQNGFGKRTPLSDYRTQSRGGKGIFTIKVTDRNGPVVGICQVDESDHIILMTTAGTMIRSAVSEIGVVGRNTQGVRLMRVNGEEIVKSVSLIPGGADELDGEDSEVNEAPSGE